MSDYRFGFTVQIPAESVPPELLHFMGYTDQEIADFYNGDIPVTVDTRKHRMDGIVFDDYEEIK